MLGLSGDDVEVAVGPERVLEPLIPLLLDDEPVLKLLKTLLLDTTRLLELMLVVETVGRADVEPVAARTC